MTAVTQITPPVLERYEIKFVIPWSLVEPISSFAETFCTLDKYSERSHDKFYRVNNLYLDTPYLLFLRNRMDDCENRFNMRIRSYGNHPQLPYFLEIKQKRAEKMLKYRSRVYEENWYELFGPHQYDPGPVSDEKELRNRNLFKRLVYSYNAGPKVLTQYRRKAYVSDCEEYARLTFDINLRYMAEERYNLCPVEDRMVSCDHEVNFTPHCNVILELKSYTSHVPLWMMDLIRAFDLQSRGFSKYAAGMEAVMQDVWNDNPPRETTLRF
ncbi:VTC domain-containing protein [Fibrobacterota bacterium]